jgi:hypothetical protein
MVRAPVGPVFLGSTAVGADDEVAIVALKSGWVAPAGLSAPAGGVAGGAAAGGALGAFNGAEERNVAFGSNGWSVTNKPPSMVQNFWLSSGKVRLHFGQRFIRRAPLLCS